MSKKPPETVSAEKAKGAIGQTLEATAEGIEALIDALTSDEVLKELPAVGTLLKLFRSGDKARAAMLARKLETFISEAKQRTPKAAEKLRGKVEKSEAEALRIGEVVTHVLDRAAQDGKPKLAAQVFVGFLEGRIDEEQLRRLLFAIDAAFIDDLNRLLDWDLNIHPSHGAAWIPFMSGAGFARIRVDTKFDESAVEYEWTELARLLRVAVEPTSR